MQTEGPSDSIAIDYTNHRDERRHRFVLPIKIWFGVTDWHPAPQWFLRAFDFEKMKSRDFAMLKIHAWGRP